MKALVIFCAMMGMLGSASFAKTDGVPADSTQMIVVTTKDWNSVEGRMQMWERTPGGRSWRPASDAFPIVVGKNGMAWGSGISLPAVARQSGDPVKREGDGRSPAGIFQLGTAFGYASEPLAGTMLHYLSLSSSTECVDDVDSTSYNRIVDRSKGTVDWKSSEHMRDVGEAYRWGVVVNHNGIANPESAPSPTRGGGSCIFLHIWKDASHGTAGCTAMEPANIEAVLRWLDPKRKPILVQLPSAAYARMLEQLDLPGLGLSTRP